MVAENFVERSLAKLTHNRAQFAERFGDFGLSNIRFRHQPSNRFAVARDADSAAALHFVQQLGKFRLGVSGLIFENVAICLTG